MGEWKRCILMGRFDTIFNEEFDVDRESLEFTIRIDKFNRKKESLGHQENDLGCGRHKETRKKRKSTRERQRKEWEEENDF